METNPSAILQTTGRSTSELLVMEQVKAVALDPPLMGYISPTSWFHYLGHIVDFLNNTFDNWWALVQVAEVDSEVHSLTPRWE